MKKFLFVLFFLALHLCVSAQQFSQYNTGTLYDAFDNPAQKAFIPDSSRKVAFNIFFPNFNTDATLAGNAQGALKSRAFLSHYADNTLTIGQKNYNYLNANINAYAFMLKIYNDLSGDEELGFFAQSRFEGRGVFSDESVQIVADNTAFSQPTYNDLFNTHFNYQAYHQFGVSYRSNVDKQLAFGIKLSMLLGIVMNKVDINRSVINFDRLDNRAFLSLEGNYYASFEPGKFTTHDLLPTFKNPGAAISFGTSYITDDKTKIQLNIKDLGFIHWNKLSLVGQFNNTGVIDSLTLPGIEDRLARAASGLVQSNSAPRSFTTPTDSKIELSASRAYLLSEDVKYTPTVVLSKELFYTGFTTALVNHFQYRNFVGTLTGAYNEMHFFSLGTQLMVKSPNAEFFIGTDRVGQTASLLRAATNNESGQITRNGTYSGMNFFMGFSIKMGGLIEHPHNASSIPMGDHRNFVQRFWQRITKKED